MGLVLLLPMKRLLLTSALAVGLGVGVFMAPASPTGIGASTVSADLASDADDWYYWGPDPYDNSPFWYLEPMGPCPGGWGC